MNNEVEYVKYDPTANLLLRELLDLHEELNKSDYAEGDRNQTFRDRFIKLHKFLQNGGQFPTDWVTKRNQHSVDHWNKVGRS